MRTKMTLSRPEAALSRLLEALERELIEASDEEIMAAAADLGMNPAMQGSAAFAGLKYPANLRFADFFRDIDGWRETRAEDERIAQPAPRMLSRSRQGKSTDDK